MPVDALVLSPGEMLMPGQSFAPQGRWVLATGGARPPQRTSATRGNRSSLRNPPRWGRRSFWHRHARLAMLSVMAKCPNRTRLIFDAAADQTGPTISPELDLLERLSAEDCNLHQAATQSCYAFRDLAHAKRVVGIYVEGGLVELYDKTSDPAASTPFHAARWIIADDANWVKETTYWLRLTERGYAAFARDSTGLFDRLFSDTDAE